MNIKHNVSEIKRLLQERKEAMHSLSRFLIAKGISPSVTEEIVLALVQEGNELGNVKEVVAAKVRVTGSSHSAITDTCASWAHRRGENHNSSEACRLLYATKEKSRINVI